MARKKESKRVSLVTLMNKLTFGRDKVLLPFSEMLKNTQSTEVLMRIDEIDVQLEKNMERRQQILQFFSKGLLDPAVYAEEGDGLR